MFLHARSDGEYIGVKDDILCRESNLLCQYLIRALAYLYPALIAICLSHFVKGHHDHRSAILPDQIGLTDKFFFATFE